MLNDDSYTQLCWKYAVRAHVTDKQVSFRWKRCSKLRKVNNAIVLVSYRVMYSYSLVKAIENERSLYSYWCIWINCASNRWDKNKTYHRYPFSRRIPVYPHSHRYKTPHIVSVKVSPYVRILVLTHSLNRAIEGGSGSNDRKRHLS